MSQKPLPVFTSRRSDFDDWLYMLCGSYRRPVSVTPLFSWDETRAPFMVPYYSDYGDLSFFINERHHFLADMLFDFIEQAKKDKFRAVYLLDGKQDVMLFRNKYCERLTPDYVMHAPIEELQSLAWAGKAENVGTLTLKPVEV